MTQELIIDLFAGGGGASTGMEQAAGRSVDHAVNHDPEALSMHTINHPQTRHHCTDIFEIDPLAVTNGQPVGILWASPDCKHFSKAKGGRLIYEGDIVKDERNRIMRVIWRDYGAFNFSLLKIDMDKFPRSDNFKIENMSSWFLPGEIEPEEIGNIHENPELLEKDL